MNRSLPVRFGMLTLWMVPIACDGDARSGDPACDALCADWGQFVDACMDDWAEQGTFMICDESFEAVLNAMDPATGTIAVAAQSGAPGISDHQCASGSEASMTCVWRKRAQHELMSPEAWGVIAAGCETRRDDPLYPFEKALDCQGWLDAARGL